MGECIILRRRAVAKSALPVLDPNYPADMSGMQSNGYFNLEVILKQGNPDECTYQWYYGDGTKIVGATLPTLGINRYNAVGTSSYYCEVTNAKGTVRSRTATLTIKAAYLYNGGDVNADITGGFDLVPAISNGAYELGTFEYDNAMLYVNLLSAGRTMQGFCSTRKPVDLTNYKTIRFTVVTSYTNSYYNPWTFCATNTKSGAIAGAVAELSVNVPERTETTTRTYDVDVSNVSGEYYIGFGNAVNNVNTYLGVSAIQLLY